MRSLADLPPWRRLTIAFASLVLSVGIFRAEIASALVTRGDEFLSRGDVPGARHYYERALALQWDSHAATDRFVFFGSGSHDRDVLRGAIRVATVYLRVHPADATILADRAYCFERLHAYAPAARDFAAAARITKSPTEFTFAGWAALRSGRAADARSFWRDALVRDPRFGPARLALRKVRR